MGVIKATLGDIYRSVNVQLVSALFQLMMSMGNKHLPSSPYPPVICSWWFLLSPVSLFPCRTKVAEVECPYQQVVPLFLSHVLVE